MFSIDDLEREARAQTPIVAAMLRQGVQAMRQVEALERWLDAAQRQGREMVERTIAGADMLARGDHLKVDR